MHKNVVSVKAVRQVSNLETFLQYEELQDVPEDTPHPRYRYAEKPQLGFQKARADALALSPFSGSNTT